MIRYVIEGIVGRVCFRVLGIERGEEKGRGDKGWIVLGFEC